MHSMAVVHPAYVLIVWALLLLLLLVCVEATPEGATMWAQLRLGASAAALHSSTVAGVVHCVVCAGWARAVYSVHGMGV